MINFLGMPSINKQDEGMGHFIPFSHFCIFHESFRTSSNVPGSAKALRFGVPKLLEILKRFSKFHLIGFVIIKYTSKSDKKISVPD